MYYHCTCTVCRHDVSFFLSQPLWQPYLGANGKMLDISLSYSQTLWPWSGWIAITISVTKEGSAFTGQAAGQITLTISTPTVRIALLLNIIVFIEA